MKVMLINPPDSAQDDFSNPPLGLLSLASYVRDICDVCVVDGYINGWSGIVNAIEEYDPDLIGVTCLTPGRHEALRVMRIAKMHNPKTITVLGGVHPTLMWWQLLHEYRDLDYIVMGEGEQTLREIILGDPIKNIDGLAFRCGNHIYKNHVRRYTNNLDDYSMPAWDLIDLSKYPARGVDGMPRIGVAFGRGCVGHCNFCSTWKIWRGYRHRTPENMADELEYLYNNGYTSFSFTDDCFTVDRQAIIELCGEIQRRKLSIMFIASTRTDKVDPELLSCLKNAGCYEISYGIETASPGLLEDMGKDNCIENNRKAIQDTKQAGIRAVALMITGNMGETDQTINDTLQFLRESKPDGVGCVGGLWVLPGTKVYDVCKQRGLITDDYWLGSEPYMLYTAEASKEKICEWRDQIINYDLEARLKNTYNMALGKLRGMV